ALLVARHGLFARDVPVDVGQVHHAVDVVVEADEQTEFGGVLDFAFDGRAQRMLFQERIPGVGHGLLEAQRDAALGGVHIQHHHVDFLRGRHDLAGGHVLLGPRHFRHVKRAPTGYLASTPSQGSDCSCFMPSEMRWVSGLILTICTLTVSPTARTWLGCETRFQLMSVTCSRPSMPPRSTNAPRSVMFLTTPSRI